MQSALRVKLADMAFTSLTGNEMVERLLLLITEQVCFVVC